MEFVAEACMMFGWTDEYVLAMPFHRFCSMLKNGRRWHARRMIELIDIQSIAIGTPDRYTQVREAYSNLFDFEAANRTQVPQIDTSNQNHVALIKEMFAAVKRG